MRTDDPAPVHVMQMAKVGTHYAARHGLNPNHHARIWCSCMDNPKYAPGSFSERPANVVRSDPRRLGSFDHLAIVDMRIPNSGILAWQEHVEKSDTPEAAS